jgi:hypothetical protein
MLDIVADDAFTSLNDWQPTCSGEIGLELQAHSVGPSRLTTKPGGLAASISPIHDQCFDLVLIILHCSESDVSFLALHHPSSMESSPPILIVLIDK